MLEHDGVLGTYNSLVMIDATHFILAYRGGSTNGWIKTFSMEAAAPPTEEAPVQSEFWYK